MSEPANLFSPMKLGEIVLKNRFVMAPMTRSRADERHAPTDMNALYYAQRSGAGLIITEGTPPDPMGQGYLRLPGIYTREQVEGWRKVTAAVHARAAVIFQQLMYVGRVSHPSFLGGLIPVGPSAIAVGEGQVFTATGPQPFVTPRALETDEVSAVIATYGRATRLSEEAGFDGVELHATSGYLPAQFLLPTINRRTDQWGGSVEKRARFMLEAVDAMAAVRGPERVGVRIGPAFTFNDAHDPDPHATWDYVLPELARRKLAYLSLINVPAEWDVLGFVRERWPGILIVAGGYDHDRANADLAAGRAELIGFGKSFIANPDLPKGSRGMRRSTNRTSRVFTAKARRAMSTIPRSTATKARKFFFEKKALPAVREPKNFYFLSHGRSNQKVFTSWACAAGENRDSDAKVFCFFSSEKKALLAVSLALADLV